MLTAKRELFAQHVAAGLSQAEAYRQAGYSVANMRPNTLYIEAVRLASNPLVSQRIAELRAAAAESAVMSAAQVQEKLSNIAAARLSDVVSWDNNGVTVIPSEDLPKHVLDAVQSVKVKRRRVWIGTGENAEPWEIQEMEFKMHNPIDAARELSKLRGDYPKEQQNVNVFVDNRAQMLTMFGTKEELLKAAREVNEPE